MSEEQFGTTDAAVEQPYHTHQSPLAEPGRPGLPRAPRVVSAHQSYRAETAWIWQRARLVCAVKNANS